MKIETVLKKNIAEINAIYGDLHNQSNDALRASMQRIEGKIKLHENQEDILNQHLTKVFALIKETARRFSVGDIVVTANDNDKRIVAQKEYDFIDIKGEKAIYHRRWTAAGESVDWCMVHYDEQLMGGYLLHYGYATEMATGEGKTLVTTLPVLLNALLHRGVHVMTTNSYLSMRDYEITRPLYMFFGLSVDCIEKYERNDMRHKMAYDCDITYGANSTFIFDYLFDHLEMNPRRCVQRKYHNFAIVDELDSILVDEATTPHIISGGGPIDERKLYKEMNPYVKELLSLGHEYYTVNALSKVATFTTKGKEWLSRRTHIDNLFSLKKQYQIKDFNSLSQKSKTDVIKMLRTQNALNRLLSAYTVCTRDVDYIVEGGKIVIIDSNTGRQRPSCRWGYGLHTAVEVKEGVTLCPDTLSSATISIKNYYKLYHKVSGMSGTLSQVKDELREQYGLGFYNVPTHKPVIRKDWEITAFNSKEEKDNAVVDQIIKNISNGRPSLVGCKTIRHCEEICKLLDAKGIPYNALNAKQENDEAIIISKAGIGDTVTIATSIAGRGTDIKPSEDALRKGGLMVIGCDLFDSLRVERQLRGRTGRKGDPGDSMCFVSMDEVVLKKLPDKDYKRLQNLASNVDLTQNEVIPYFLKAQKIQENNDRESRKRVSVKDDAIAPYRKEYYELRNDILFNPYSAESLVRKTVADVHGDISCVESHIKCMHDIVCDFVNRTLRNDQQSITIDVPFSDDGHLYIIEINREKTQQITYFQSEFFRQTILQVYDRRWQDLMNHLLSDLDDYETSMLVSKYKEMQGEINKIIYSRLTKSKVVFNKNEAIEGDNSSQGVRNPITARCNKPNNYPLDAPCPCKSGKKYRDCHGLRLGHGSRRR